MSAFKNINRSDVVTVPYVANKNWSISSSLFNTYDIKLLSGKKATGSFDPLNEEIYNDEYQRLVFDSINHYFYQSYSGSLISTQSRMFTTHFFDESPYRPSGSYYDYGIAGYTHKDFPTSSNAEIKVISIGRSIVGESIKPGSLSITGSYNLTDDGGGNLYDNVNLVGNIFYKHGLAIITNHVYQDILSSSMYVNFTNEHTVYENTIKCTVLDREFNYSYNPTVCVTGSLTDLLPFATSASFSPYVTTIGLYNDKSELLAVAKLGQPIPLSSEIDFNFIIKLDW